MLTIERLKEVLSYDPETGLFTRLIDVGSRGKAGDIAGGVTDRGYLVIQIDGKTYRCARLAWFYMTGRWPIEADHEDLDRGNNRWTNLREATRKGNVCNRKLGSRNTSGFKGVSWSKLLGCWIATIGFDGKKKYLGSFDRADDAHAAYCVAAVEHHGEFARVE